MNKPPAPDQPPGPKTALRSGAGRDPFSLIAGKRDHAALQDRGAAVRRDLADEIRAQLAPTTRKRRRR